MHDTVDHAGFAYGGDELDAFGDRLRDRLLGIDVLAGADSLQDRLLPLRGDLGVEVDGRRAIVQCLVEAGGEVGDAVLGRERSKLVGVPADQDRLDRDAIAIGETDTALISDGQNGTDQVLPVAHPAGHAVHDHSNRARSHRLSQRRAEVPENAFTSAAGRISSRRPAVQSARPAGVRGPRTPKSFSMVSASPRALTL